MALYFMVLISVSFIFLQHIMPLYAVLISSIETVTFFYFSNLLSKEWADYSIKLFIKKIFYASLIIRLGWVIFSYILYLGMTGQPFEFYAGDSMMYDSVATMLGRQTFHNYSALMASFDLSDRGFPTYLGFVYMIFGHIIIIPRIINAFLGAWTAVLIYKVASRNFGESIGRIAGILTMLMPNFIIYSGFTLKEVIMVFLIVLFIERVDKLLRSPQIKPFSVFLSMLLIVLMLTFRSILAYTAFASFMLAIVLSSKRIFGLGQRFITGLAITVIVAYFAGGTIINNAEEIWQKSKGVQKTNMQWRSEREGGNAFAKYASKAVFFPAIFNIPVPTMVNVEHQINQQLMNGGNFSKEILAFFVLFAFILIIKKKKWRDFILIESFFLGYLFILASSNFAQAERFHQPILPFFMMFAAYGISNVTNKTKKYYLGYLVFIFIIIIAWNWFKLAGRGMA